MSVEEVETEAISTPGNEKKTNDKFKYQGEVDDGVL